MARLINCWFCLLQLSDALTKKTYISKSSKGRRLPLIIIIIIMIIIMIITTNILTG